MNKRQSSLNNHNSSNDSRDNHNKNQKTLENYSDLENEENINTNPKIRIEKSWNIAISSPFFTDSSSISNKFDEKEIKEKLEETLYEEDYHLIDKIIEDKKIFPNDLTYEKGVFRDNNGNLLEVFIGEKEGFYI